MLAFECPGIKVAVDTYFNWMSKANRIAVEALDFTDQLPERNGNGQKRETNGKRKLLKRRMSREGIEPSTY